jgi:hypothetical protein
MEVFTFLNLFKNYRFLSLKSSLYGRRIFSFVKQHDTTLFSLKLKACNHHCFWILFISSFFCFKMDYKKLSKNSDGYSLFRLRRKRGLNYFLRSAKNP